MAQVCLWMTRCLKKVSDTSVTHELLCTQKAVNLVSLSCLNSSRPGTVVSSSYIYIPCDYNILVLLTHYCMYGT
jgi:hypothetical protein